MGYSDVDVSQSCFLVMLKAWLYLMFYHLA